MNSMFGGQGAAPTGKTKSNTSTGFYKEKVPSGYSKGKLQQFTPEQIDLFQQLFGNLGPDSFTSRLAGGDQSQFEQLEAPALRQFGEFQGGLASRFSGMGGGGGGGQQALSSRNSSGFKNAANQQASDFAQQLQSQRMGLQRNALSDLFNMSNVLLGQKPFENLLTQKPQETSWAETIGKFGGMVPGLVTSLFKGGGSAGDAFKGASQIPGAIMGATGGGPSIQSTGPGMNKMFSQSNWG